MRAEALRASRLLPKTIARPSRTGSYLHGPYDIAFFRRHNASFRVAAALHLSHAKPHAVLLRTPFARGAEVGSQFDLEAVGFVQHLPARTEPTQECYAPYTAAVMVQPYLPRFHNHYPRSNNFFSGAPWWDPIIYEAVMLGGNDQEQDMVARPTPESANILDNLPMFHGVPHDILAYEGWSIEQKWAKLYHVI